MSIPFSEKKISYHGFFCGGRGLNPRRCLYYALSIPTELSSQRHTMVYYLVTCQTTNKHFELFKKIC